MLPLWAQPLGLVLLLIFVNIYFFLSLKQSGICLEGRDRRGWLCFLPCTLLPDISAQAALFSASGLTKQLGLCLWLQHRAQGLMRACSCHTWVYFPSETLEPVFWLHEHHIGSIGLELRHSEHSKCFQKYSRSKFEQTTKRLWWKATWLETDVHIIFYEIRDRVIFESFETQGHVSERMSLPLPPQFHISKCFEICCLRFEHCSNQHKCGDYSFSNKDTARKMDICYCFFNL